ncbi:MAG: hypothetical protein ACJ79H_14460 [Myxococcales bacterium]
MSNLTCPLCGSEKSRNFVLEVIHLEGADAIEYRCSACGVFRCTREFNDGARQFLGDDAAKLSWAVRAATDSAGALSTILDPLSYKEVSAGVSPPADPLEQLDRLLVAIGSRLQRFEDQAIDAPGAWQARAFARSHAEFDRLARELLGSIEQSESRFTEHPYLNKYSLTKEGWERYRRLQGSSPSGNQAFVAMSFAEELKAIFHSGIAAALRESGWSPYRADVAEHNGMIIDEVIAQIRASRLVIADATGDRHNVYFEAGFAEGLGRPVIWTIQQGAVRHFDVNQRNFIEWTEAEGLRRRLVSRINAIGLGRAPRK